MRNILIIRLLILGVLWNTDFAFYINIHLHIAYKAFYTYILSLVIVNDTYYIFE